MVSLSRSSVFCFLFPDRLWHWSPHHICGSGSYGDGPACVVIPGALHSPYQPGGGAVAQGVAFVLDREWICGEYQFDMSAFGWEMSSVIYNN